MPIQAVTPGRAGQASDPFAQGQHRVDELFDVLSDIGLRNLEVPLLKEAGLFGDGLTDDGPALAALAPGSYFGTGGAFRISTNALVPAGVVLFMLSGSLAPDVGVAVTLAAGATLVHLGDGVGGAGTVVKGSGRLIDLSTVLVATGNLAGLTDLAAARTNLGVGTLGTRTQLLLGDASDLSIPSSALAMKEFTNLVQDPKLGLGLAYWYSVSSQVTRVAVTNHPSALWALRFQPGQGTAISAAARSGPTIQGLAGDSYYCHFDAIAEIAGGTSQVQMVISCLQQDGTTTNLTVAGTPTVSWQTFSGTATLPAGTVTFGITLQRPANADGTTTYYRVTNIAARRIERTSNILDTAVTYAKIQNVSATSRLLGRVTAGAGTAEEIAFSTFAQAANNLSDVASANLSRNNIFKGTVPLTDATTIATNAALGNVFTVTLGGNRTLGAPTNLAAGAAYTWFVKQDATGSRTLAYAAAFNWGAAGAPTLTTTGAKTDVISAWTPDGTNLFAAIAKGF